MAGDVHLLSLELSLLVIYFHLFCSYCLIRLAAGMAVIATSALIGRALGDKDDGQSASDHVIAISFAVSLPCLFWHLLTNQIGGLWIMNLFTNVIQGPGRALVNDVVEPDKLQLANAVVSAVMAIAAISANLVGAQFVNSPNPYFIIFCILERDFCSPVHPKKAFPLTLQ